MTHTLSPATRKAAFLMSSRNAVDGLRSATLPSATLSAAFVSTSSVRSRLRSAVCTGAELIRHDAGVEVSGLTYLGVDYPKPIHGVGYSFSCVSLTNTR